MRYAFAGLLLATQLAALPLDSGVKREIVVKTFYGAPPDLHDQIPKELAKLR